MRPDYVSRRSERPSGSPLLFVVVYGWCNWITAQRPDVGTLLLRMGTRYPVRAADDRSLPVDRSVLRRGAVSLSGRTGSGYVFQTHHRGDRGRWNLLSALSVSVCLRATTREWLARRSVRLVSRMDQPSILIPSLHIALRAILAQHYARHTRGLWRAASNSLVCFGRSLNSSHLSAPFSGRRDGLVLGVYCIYFIREPSSISVPGTRRDRPLLRRGD